MCTAGTDLAWVRFSNFHVAREHSKENATISIKVNNIRIKDFFWEARGIPAGARGDNACKTGVRVIQLAMLWGGGIPALYTSSDFASSSQPDSLI